MVKVTVVQTPKKRSPIITIALFLGGSMALLVVFGMVWEMGTTFAKINKSFAEKPSMQASRTAAASAQLRESAVQIQALRAQADRYKRKRGIGVSRHAVESAFEDPDVGFTFTRSTPVRGEERTMGEIPSNLAVIELIGDSDNLSSASILFVATGSDAQVQLSAIYSLGFLQEIAPGWSGAVDWLTQAAYQVDATGEPVSKVDGDRIITLKNSVPGLFLLTIESAS